MIGETPAIRDIWDYERSDKSWRPIGEDAFSDYVARHLKIDLENSGIISLREVEVRTKEIGKGERTDLYVAAFFDDEGDEQKVIRVIVEVKGCWHKEVFTAMRTQLCDRYMNDAQLSYGVYLVGWFMCDKWGDADYRKGSTDSETVESCQRILDEQAMSLARDNRSVVAVVLDVGLR